MTTPGHVGKAKTSPVLIVVAVALFVLWLVLSLTENQPPQAHVPDVPLRAVVANPEVPPAQ